MAAENLAFAGRHTMDSPEWYTPSFIVDGAREVMGDIDLDPASHEEANRIVKARRFFTVEDDGLLQPWRGRILVNPPGGKDPNRGNKSLVPLFWSHLLQERDAASMLHEDFEAIWIGYSLEQIQTLQSIRGIQTPISFPMCVPRQRIAFVENEAKRLARIEKFKAEGKTIKENQPSHANYISYIGPNSGQFRRVFEKIGAVRL